MNGEALEKLLAATRATGAPMAMDCALSIATGLCATLHALHEAAGRDGKLGVAHGEVSPASVIVGLDGAVALGDAASDAAYHAPERARGRAALDRRSDVFSLGVVVYELTTGERPSFDGGKPARPSMVVPGYPLALEAIVMRALASEPARRYPTVLELQNQLEGYAREHRIRLSPQIVASASAGRPRGFVEPELARTWVGGQFDDSDVAPRDSIPALPPVPPVGSAAAKRVTPRASSPGISAPPNVRASSPGLGEATALTDTSTWLPTPASPSPRPEDLLPVVARRAARAPSLTLGGGELARGSEPPGGRFGGAAMMASEPPPGNGNGPPSGIRRRHDEQTLRGTPRPGTSPGAPEVPGFAPAVPGSRASSQPMPPTPPAPTMPVPNQPGAVPIMTPAMALSALPMVPSGGTLVSSAVSAGSAPQAHGASTLSGGLVGRAGQTMAQHAQQGFPSQPPAYAPAAPPLGYPPPGPTLPAMGAPAAPTMIGEVPAMPSPVPSPAAVPTLMLHTRRHSRVPLIIGAIGLAAGTAVGVWFVMGRGGSAAEPEAPAVTAPAAPVSNKAHKPRVDEAEAPSAADVRKADNAAAGSAAPAPPPAAEPARAAASPPAAVQAAAPPPAAGAPPPAEPTPTAAVARPLAPTDDASETKHKKPKRHRKPDSKEAPWDANSPFMPVH